MRMILYFIGSLIVLGGICYAAILIGVPTVWVGVIGAVILGLGVIGMSRTANSTTTTTTTEPRAGTVVNKVE
ncbi:MAG: hypothetical protein JWO82_3397 [Akkermansiaceae bacterium]|nr:hypothetical protein [Akkermansiaceae bacterium]